MERALLMEAQTKWLWQLFLQLWQLFNSCRQDYFITHIRSHSDLMEGLASGTRRLTNWWHHFGCLLLPSLINSLGLGELKSFFIRVQRFYLSNLAYCYRMPKELSQLVCNVRVWLVAWVRVPTLVALDLCSYDKLMWLSMFPLVISNTFMWLWIPFLLWFGTLQW